MAGHSRFQHFKTVWVALSAWGAMHAFCQRSFFGSSFTYAYTCPWILRSAWHQMALPSLVPEQSIVAVATEHSDAPVGGELQTPAYYLLHIRTTYYSPPTTYSLLRTTIYNLQLITY